MVAIFNMYLENDLERRMKTKPTKQKCGETLHNFNNFNKILANQTIKIIFRMDKVTL